MIEFKSLNITHVAYALFTLLHFDSMVTFTCVLSCIFVFVNSFQCDTRKCRNILVSMDACFLLFSLRSYFWIKVISGFYHYYTLLSYYNNHGNLKQKEHRLQFCSLKSCVTIAICYIVIEFLCLLNQI